MTSTRTIKRPFSCTQCDNVFWTKQNLNKHVRVQHGEKPYSCKQCNQTYIHSDSLKRHIKAHNMGRMFTCNQCDKTFRYKKYFLEHMLTHTGEKKPYQCNQCEMAFIYKNELLVHLKIHGAKPYQCTQCDKAFSYNSDLIGHNRIHADEMTYQCTQCDTTFSDNKYLIKHKMTHTNQKLFKCSQCDKTFQGKSDLEIHKRLHTGERPDSCSRCNKIYSYSHSLKQHMMLNNCHQHPFKCNNCEKTFMSQRALLTHMKMHITGESNISTSESILTDARYMQSSNSVSLELKDKTVESVYDYSNIYNEAGLVDPNWLHELKNSDFYNFSKPKKQLKEGVMDSSHRDMDNWNVMEVEIKEEPIISEMSCNNILNKEAFIYESKSIVHKEEHNEKMFQCIQCEKKTYTNETPYTCSSQCHKGLLEGKGDKIDSSSRDMDDLSEPKVEIKEEQISIENNFTENLCEQVEVNKEKVVDIKKDDFDNLTELKIEVKDELIDFKFLWLKRILKKYRYMTRIISINFL